MTAAQLRKSIERSGRTIRGASKELEIHERTMHRYVSGEALIPKVVELVVRCWAEHQPDNQSEQRK